MPYEYELGARVGIRARLARAYLRWRGLQVDRPAQPRPPVTTHLFRVEHRPTADQHFVHVSVTSEEWAPKRRGHVWEADWDVRHEWAFLAVHRLHPDLQGGLDRAVLVRDEHPFPSREAADRAVGMYRESLGYGSRVDHAFVMHSVGGREPHAGFPPAALLR